jgi:hypothetical protein
MSSSGYTFDGEVQVIIDGVQYDLLVESSFVEADFNDDGIARRVDLGKLVVTHVWISDQDDPLPNDNRDGLVETNRALIEEAVIEAYADACVAHYESLAEL